MNTVLTHSSSQSNRGFSSVSGNLFLFLAFPSHIDYCFSSIISVNTPRVSAHAHPTPTMLVFSGESPVISEGLLLPLPVSLKLSIWCFIWNVTHYSLLLNREPSGEVETRLDIPDLEQEEIDHTLGNEELSFTVLCCSRTYCTSGAEDKLGKLT